MSTTSCPINSEPGPVKSTRLSSRWIRARAARFVQPQAANAEKLEQLRVCLRRFCDDLPQASIVEVDYSPECVAEVARRFMAGNVVPKKACDGSERPLKTKFL
jgi:hypothetical protein